MRRSIAKMSDKIILMGYHGVQKSEFCDNCLVFLNNVFKHVESFICSETSQLHRKYTGIWYMGISTQNKQFVFVAVVKWESA
jgi:hypothetical protein